MNLGQLLFAQMDDGAAAAGGAMAVVILLLQLAVSVLVIASTWVVFTKAGKPGWAAIIPIYNLVVLLEIIGRPIWWLLLLFIPCVNIVILFLVMIDLAKSFGKDVVFGIGLALLGIVFLPLLAFSDARYVGPAAK